MRREDVILDMTLSFLLGVLITALLMQNNHINDKDLIKHNAAKYDTVTGKLIWNDDLSEVK